jgi:hypothetical protein
VPTPEQMQRFRTLSVEERFHWLVDTLRVCYEMSPPEVHAQWRKHKT